MAYTFDLDVPSDLVAPAQVIRYAAFEGNLGGYGRSNEPKALVLHTPEEDADNNEITPRWFADPRAKASTHYYADDDGDLYQMVADRDCAWAQGTKAQTRHWKGATHINPPWGWGVSNNCRALSIEIEGRAASFEWTPEQRRTVLLWIVNRAAAYDIPLDRDHIVGHEELATNKRDPGIAYGTFDIDELVADARSLAKIEPSNALTALYTAREAIQRAIVTLEAQQ
jgi:N-acetyl-anhydromuramyl-L-alanine amidase AmpD